MIIAILCTVAFLALIWLGRRFERINEEYTANLKKIHESRVTNLKEAHEAYIDAMRDTHIATLERETARNLECIVWEERAKFLWRLLDDIDTLDDSCRNNHVKFRERVRAAQKRRNEVATSDGYVLTWKNDPKESA